MSGILDRVSLKGNLEKISHAKEQGNFHKVLEELKAHNVDFPENFCLQGKWASIIEIEKLKTGKIMRSHPFFAPLNKKIKDLNALLVDMKGGKRVYVKAALRVYQIFIKEVCEKNGKERMALIKGNAYLQTDEGSYKITQKLGHQLTSLNEYGELHKKNKYGSSAVCFHGGIHFKRPSLQSVEDPTNKDEREKQLLPLCPGNEFAVYSLDQKLHGTSVIAPVHLIKISNIWSKQVFHKMAAQNVVYKELRRLDNHNLKPVVFEFFEKHPQKKISYPFQLMRKNVIVQASHSIKGENLLDFIKKKDINKINNAYFGKLVFLHMLLATWDAKSDNFMVQTLSNGEFKIVGIDNDGIFAYPYIWNAHQKRHILKLHSVLLTFPQMSAQVDSKVKKQYLQLKPEEVFIDWLDELNKKNDSYLRQMNLWNMSAKDLKDLSLPISLDFNQICMVYKRMILLKEVLKQEKVTHWDVLAKLHPEIFHCYKGIVQKTKNPLEAQKTLFQSMVTLEEYLPQNEIAKLDKGEHVLEKTSPGSVVERMVPLLRWEKLSKVGQKYLMLKIVYSFPRLGEFHLRGIKLHGSDLEPYIKKVTCHTLTLEACSKLNDEWIIRFLGENKNIKTLVLEDYAHLSFKQFEAIVKFCSTNKYFLSVRFGGKRYVVDPKVERSLDRAFQGALEAEKLIEAEYFVKLGVKIDTKDATLFHLLCQKNCLKSLPYLLAKGVSSNVTNKKGETPLHTAAHYGQNSVIEFLLKNKATINATVELSGRTPLHYAALQNFTTTFSLLLQRGADPLKVDKGEKQSVLHIAAFYGHLDVLKVVNSSISENKWNLLVNKGDSDGKRPLHKAFCGKENPEVVKFLIAKGADVNAKNNWNYTPLHWAAKNGYVTSAKLLLGAKAKIDGINKNGKMPFDLAVSWGRGNLIRVFLGLSEKQKTDDIKSKNLEKHYRKAFYKAQEKQDPYERVLAIIDLSDFFVEEKSDFVAGAKLLNSALAILQKEKPTPKLEEYLFAKLESIEGVFLASKGLKVSYGIRGYTSKNRTVLKEIRKAAYQSLKRQNENEVKDAFNTLSNKLCGFFKRIVSDALKMCGPPPCDYSVIALGLMAKGQILPYSDLKFAVIVENDKPSVVSYFRTLSQLIELKVINLGETECSVLLGNRSSPSNGFCMNSAGKTALGKRGLYELIATPAKLAGYQTIQWMSYDPDLVGVMNNVLRIAGDWELLKKYLVARARTFIKKEEFLGGNWGRQLGYMILARNVKALQLLLAKTKDISQPVDLVKMYELLGQVIDGLGLYYGMQGRNILVQIDQLVNKKKISEDFSKKLKRALALMQSLCSEAQFFYKSNKGTYHSYGRGKIPSDKTKNITVGNRGKFKSVYEALNTLLIAAQKFLDKPGGKGFVV